jgi:hypothetical protein
MEATRMRQTVLHALKSPAVLLQGLKLAAVKLHAPVSSISFHPADNAILLTTTAGAAAAGSSPSSSIEPSTAQAAAGNSPSSHAVVLWQLHKLWERHELQAHGLPLPASCTPTCHAWAPEVGQVFYCQQPLMSMFQPL